jgi:predicted phosphodiesterase
MKKLLLLLAIAFVATATAQETKSVKIVEGPYLQAVGENEFTVVWKTDQAAVSWVEIAPDDATHFYNCERPKYYNTRYGRKQISTLHAVRVSGLEPATTYRYRIISAAAIKGEKDRILFTEQRGSDVYRRQPYFVTTLDPKKEKVTFAVVNDIHAKTAEMEALLGNVKEDGYDFVCFNGDMTSRNNSQDEVFKYYLSSASKLFAAETPLYVVRGNHETRGPGFSEYLNLFPTPTNTPYFTFRQGPVAFVVLDSGEDKPDSDIEYGGTAAYDAYREKMAEWLKEAVKSEEFRSAPVKIALLHIPFDKGVGWYGNNELKRLLLPTLNEAGIDVMLCGHTHRYSFRDVGSVDNNFPILVNSNNDKVNVRATKSQIDMEVVDATGKVLHRHTVKVE